MTESYFQRFTETYFQRFYETFNLFPIKGFLFAVRKG